MSPVTLTLAALLLPPAARAASQFDVKFRNGAIVSLQRDHDPDPARTDYVAQRRGDLVIKYRLPGGEWQRVQTASLAAEGAGTFSTNAEGTVSRALYQINNNSASASGPYAIRAGKGIVAKVNLTGGREEVVPLPMDGPTRNFTLTKK